MSGRVTCAICEICPRLRLLSLWPCYEYSRGVDVETHSVTTEIGVIRRGITSGPIKDTQNIDGGVVLIYVGVKSLH